MGRILVGLEELDRSLRAEPSHPLLGSGSLHASLIEGGQELSSYPERCLLRLERRTIPSETPERVEAEIRDVIDRAAAADPDLVADVRTTFAQSPFEVGEAEDVVAALLRQATAVTAEEVDVVGVPFWTDAAILASAGIPTVLYGPAGEGAHAVVEWVDLDSATRCAEVYLAVVRDFCA